MFPFDFLQNKNVFFINTYFILIATIREKCNWMVEIYKELVFCFISRFRKNYAAYKLIFFIILFRSVWFKILRGDFATFCFVNYFFRVGEHYGKNFEKAMLLKWNLEFFKILKLYFTLDTLKSNKMIEKKRFRGLRRFSGSWSWNEKIFLDFNSQKSVNIFRKMAASKWNIKYV